MKKTLTILTILLLAAKIAAITPISGKAKAPAQKTKAAKTDSYLMHNTLSTESEYYFPNNGGSIMENGSFSIYNGLNIGFEGNYNYNYAALDVARGSYPYGTAIFHGTYNASYFNYSTNEDTYIRGGKLGSKVLIGDVNNGGVGIGTSNPRCMLDVNGKAYFGGSIKTPSGNELVFGENSNIGTNRLVIGLWNNLHSYVTYKENLYFRADNPYYSALTLYGDNSVGIGYATTYESGNYATNGNKLSVNGNTYINGNSNINGNTFVSGNVGIGTTDTNGNLLSVNGNTYINGNAIVVGNSNINGKVTAKSVKITNKTGADFVFAPNYKLLTLAEVEAFIANNKHLPNIAPSAEMEKDGLDLGDFQINLLQKIEELTLYTIELKKDNEAQAKANKDLQQQLLVIKKEMSEIRKTLSK